MLCSQAYPEVDVCAHWWSDGADKCHGLSLKSHEKSSSRVTLTCSRWTPSTGSEHGNDMCRSLPVASDGW
jgi:hypothetical protein